MLPWQWLRCGGLPLCVPPTREYLISSENFVACKSAWVKQFRIIRNRPPSIRSIRNRCTNWGKPMFAWEDRRMRSRHSPGIER